MRNRLPVGQGAHLRPATGLSASRPESPGCAAARGLGRSGWRRHSALSLCLALILLGTVTYPSAAAADFGFRDFSYGSGVTAPTGEKPQSKLWHTSGGQWWGALWSTAKASFTIQRFDKATNVWTDTGVKIDNRRTSSPDVLWTGSKLYVVSGLKENSTQTDARVLVYRYSFNGTAYSLDTGFPTTVTHGKPEAMVLDRDSTGKLWITYTAGNNGTGRSVFVAHTTSSDTTWGAPYVLPVPDADNLAADDISTIVAYGGSSGRSIGVLYSNQNDETLSFAIHRDGDGDAAADWNRIVLTSGPKVPDDHLSIKSLMSDDSGRVFAVVKTSLNDKSPVNGADPLIVLYRLSGTSFSSSTVWTVADSVTRGILVLDSENRNAHVFGASPCCSGGAAYMKSSSYDSPAFSSGLGTPLISLASDPKVNNVTSTKQEVDSTSGLLVAASDDSTRFYVHNFLALGAPPPPVDTMPPDTAIDGGPSGSVAATSAGFSFSSSESGSTFECRLDDGGWAPCTSPRSFEALAVGSHTFEVRATDAAGNVDSSPASRTWAITAPSASFSDDFETGNLSRWTVVSGGDGVARVQSSAVASGAYAAAFSESASAGSFAYARAAFPTALMNFTASGDFNVMQQGVSGGNVPLLRFLDASGARIVVLYRQNGNTGELWVTQNGTRVLTAGRLPLNEWHNLALDVKIAGAASVVRVRVDGRQAYSTVNANLGTGAITTMQLGNDTAAQQFSLAVDNIEVRPGS